MKLWLAALVDVRAEERRRVATMFSLLALIIATSYILKPVRSSLFLSQFGSENLPYVYILVALVMGVVAWGFAKWSPAMRLPILFERTAYFFAFSLAVFWVATTSGFPWTGFVFYVWVSIITALMPSLFWLFANYVFYSNEGRRLFPIVMAGGLLGSIAGGALTSTLVTVVGTAGLLLTAIVLLCVVAALVRSSAAQEKVRMRERRAELSREERSRQAAGAEESPWALLTGSRYLSLLAALIFLTTMCSTLIDYQFNTVVESSFETMDELTGFFGKFFTAINVIAFFVQLFAVGRLLTWFGVGAGLLALPASLLGSSVAFLAAPRLLTAALMKSADDGLSNSMNRASVEVLYLPIALAVKNRLKAWLDMFVERSSRGFAGLSILLATNVFALTADRLGFLVIGLIIPWIVVVVFLRQEYLKTFQDSLARRDIRDLQATLRDPASLSVLRKMLDRTDTRELIYALELLPGVDDPEILARARELSTAESPVIRKAALHLLRESTEPPSFDDFAERIRDPDPGAAAEAIALWLRVDETEGLEALRAYVQRANAKQIDAILDTVTLTPDAIDNTEVQTFVMQRFEADNPQHRRLAAKAAGFLEPSSTAVNSLTALISDPDIDVARAAATSMGQLGYQAGFPLLIEALERRPLRAAARRALARLGGETLERVASLLRDRTRPAARQAALPLVLAQFDDARAVSALFELLPQQDRRLQFQGVRGLGKLRARFPQLRFAPKEVDRLLEHEARELVKLANLRRAIRSVPIELPTHALVNQTLEERLELSVELIFRLLGLTYPPDELKSAWDRVQNAGPSARAAALEFLSNIFSVEQRAFLYPLLEATSWDEVASRGLESRKAPALDFDGALRELLHDDDSWLAATAVTLVGKLPDSALTGELASLEAHEAHVVREAVAGARS